jgi:hypothetical protein
MRAEDFNQVVFAIVELLALMIEMNKKAEGVYNLAKLLGLSEEK